MSGYRSLVDTCFLSRSLCATALVSLLLATTAAAQDGIGRRYAEEARLSAMNPLPPVTAELQVERLPPVPSQDKAIFEPPADRVALLPPSADGQSFLTDPRDPGLPYELLEPDEQSAILAPKPPPGFKDGMLQFTTFRKTFLLGGNRETGFGMQDFLLQTVFAFPFFTREKPIFITPYFQAHILQGPVAVDMPPQVYDVSLEFRILRQLTPKLGMDLAFAPAILSDFQNMSSQAYRWTGRGVLLYTWRPTLQIAGGVTVTGRQDVPILPVGGLIWTPNEDWRAEVIFPRPKIAQRFFDGERADWWGYVAGEFGGNSYAIERADGADDVATYRDLRLVLGVERKENAGGYHRFEVGYVFDRLIEYESGTPSFTPANTVMLRAEAIF